MEFLNPVFFYGLFALAIPIIIHLFNFRRFKSIYFTNVSFIAELKQETQKQSRLRHWMVLLLRMLAIAALVFAFARPIIPANKEKAKSELIQYVSVYIDNSFSMQQEAEDGMLLENAKTSAIEIANASSLADRFQLLTNDFEGRHQRFVSRDEFIDLLEEVQTTPVVRTYDEIINRLSDGIKNNDVANQNIYVLSDFQKGFLSAIKPSSDSTAHVYWVPMQATNSNNLYIDSCWFDSPVRMLNESARLFVRIRNASSNSIEALPLNLKINGIQKAVSSLEMKAGETQIKELDFTSSENGIQFGDISLNDYPIDFDDHFYFTFQISKSIRVLSIYDQKPNTFLDSFYTNDSLFIYENSGLKQLDYASIQDHDLIILSGLISISSGLAQELSRYVSEGGSLTIFPSMFSDIRSYNEFLNTLHIPTYGFLDTTHQKVDHINSEHPLFQGVFTDVPKNIDLPKIASSYPIQVGQKIEQAPILSLMNGKPFLNVNKKGKGSVYLCAVGLSPDFSNFQQHAIFVPIMYNMAINALEASKEYYVIGENEMIDVGNKIKGDEVFKIISEDQKFETIPSFTKQNENYTLSLYDQIKRAGNYTLYSADQPIHGLAFNYDRKESIMDFYTLDNLQELIQEKHLKNIQLLTSGETSLEQVVRGINQGIPLWRWFLMAGLLFLLAEVLMLRFWKS